MEGYWYDYNLRVFVQYLLIFILIDVIDIIFVPCFRTVSVDIYLPIELALVPVFMCFRTVSVDIYRIRALKFYKKDWFSYSICWYLSLYVFFNCCKYASFRTVSVDIYLIKRWIFTKFQWSFRTVSVDIYQRNL